MLRRRLPAVYLVALLIATPALAQEAAQEGPKLAELDAWRLRALQAERDLIEVQARAAFGAKVRAISDAIDAAAKAAGVDPKDYVPDLERGVWRKREPAKP